MKLETLDTYTGSASSRRIPSVGDFSWITPSTQLSSINMNWRERELPEKVRTKHVHRLHPYLGKFVPQLVEIFLRKFEPDSVLDPFCGSGTTLVQANELGIPSTGADVSAFNCLLTKVKTDKYDMRKLDFEIRAILSRTHAELSKGPDHRLVEEEASPYLRTWFAEKALTHLLTFHSFIEDYRYSDVLKVILSGSAQIVPFHLESCQAILTLIWWGVPEMPGSFY